MYKTTNIYHKFTVRGTSLHQYKRSFIVVNYGAVHKLRHAFFWVFCTACLPASRSVTQTSTYHSILPSWRHLKNKNYLTNLSLIIYHMSSVSSSQWHDIMSLMLHTKLFFLLITKSYDRLAAIRIRRIFIICTSAISFACLCTFIWSFNCDWDVKYDWHILHTRLEMWSFTDGRNSVGCKPQSCKSILEILLLK